LSSKRQENTITGAGATGEKSLLLEGKNKTSGTTGFGAKKSFFKDQRSVLINDFVGKAQQAGRGETKGRRRDAARWARGEAEPHHDLILKAGCVGRTNGHHERRGGVRGGWG